MAKFFPDCVVAVANTVVSPMDRLASSSNWGGVVLLAAPVRRMHLCLCMYSVKMFMLTL
jgi:hypothetical protein